jgi:TonB family protein
MVTLGLVLLMGASTLAATNGACSKADTPALVNVAPATMPPIVLAYDQHGTAKLIVTLDPNLATPTKVELLQPSGDAILDSAAMQLARKTAFTAETQSCVAVGGRYFYDVVF